MVARTTIFQVVIENLFPLIYGFVECIEDVMNFMSTCRNKGGVENVDLALRVVPSRLMTSLRNNTECLQWLRRHGVSLSWSPVAYMSEHLLTSILSFDLQYASTIWNRVEVIEKSSPLGVRPTVALIPAYASRLPHSLMITRFPYDVTEINKVIIDGYDGVQFISIPNTVTSIGESCFKGLK